MQYFHLTLATYPFAAAVGTKKDIVGDQCLKQAVVCFSGNFSPGGLQVNIAGGLSHESILLLIPYAPDAT
jgi:hypothetical protein